MSQHDAQNDEPVRTESATRNANHNEPSSDMQQPERRVKDIGAPSGQERRALTDREKRERWPIG